MDDSQHEAIASHAHGAQRRGPHPAGGPHSIPAGFRPLHARHASTPVGGPWRSNPTSPTRDERTPLVRSFSTADIESAGESLDYTGCGPVAGGTIMGIHNLAIVFPQFIVSMLSQAAAGLANSADRDCGFRHLQARRRGSRHNRRICESRRQDGCRLGAPLWRSHGFGEYLLWKTAARLQYH
jgi:hypothetical protein